MKTKCYWFEKRIRLLDKKPLIKELEDIEKNIKAVIFKLAFFKKKLYNGLD